METRGEHVVCIATKDDVNLRAVGWNDGRKDPKTKEVIRKKNCGFVWYNFGW